MISGRLSLHARLIDAGCIHTGEPPTFCVSFPSSSKTIYYCRAFTSPYMPCAIDAGSERAHPVLLIGRFFVASLPIETRGGHAIKRQRWETPVVIDIPTRRIDQLWVPLIFLVRVRPIRIYTSHMSYHRFAWCGLCRR